jgi:hypothetical protein
MALQSVRGFSLKIISLKNYLLHCAAANKHVPRLFNNINLHHPAFDSRQIFYCLVGLKKIQNDKLKLKNGM